MLGVGLVHKPHGLFAGNVERCATFLRTFLDRCESEIDVSPSQAYFFWKRIGVGPLCHPMPSWNCVYTLIPCPCMVDKEGADTIGVHSSQTITFWMMITTSHFFYGIRERSHVFIPLEFKHCKDTSPLENGLYLVPQWGMGMGPGDQWSRGQPLYCSGPCLCHCKSIMSSTYTSV